MKKLIALISLSLSFGFALALANTEEGNLNHDSVSDSSNMSDETRQQAGSTGMAGDNNPPNPSVNTPPTSPSLLDPKMSDSKMPKSCTDEKGLTYNPGQKGFKECVQTDKAKHPEQMGGTLEPKLDPKSEPKSETIYKTTPTPKETNNH